MTLNRVWHLMNIWSSLQFKVFGRCLRVCRLKRSITEILEFSYNKRENYLLIFYNQFFSQCFEWKCISMRATPQTQRYATIDTKTHATNTKGSSIDSHCVTTCVTFKCVDEQNKNSFHYWMKYLVQRKSFISFNTIYVKVNEKKIFFCKSSALFW